jgi:hypothetical protein
MQARKRPLAKVYKRLNYFCKSEQHRTGLHEHCD